MRESKKTNRKNYLAVTEGYTNDIRILTALYFGNHLEEKEIKLQHKATKEANNKSHKKGGAREIHCQSTPPLSDQKETGCTISFRQ